MPKLTFSNYEGREHSYIKHYLLERYLSRWGFKIGSKWDPLVFIDGFAGPWGAKDAEFSDASFGIAIRAMNQAVRVLKSLGRSTHGVCIFVEKEPAAFARLEKFTNDHSSDSVQAIALRGRFTDKIPDINSHVLAIGPNPFKLVFLDQKGWAATPMSKLKPFVSSRPCELFFNVMTSFLTRFVDHPNLTSSYDGLFGRRGIIEKVRALPRGQGLREQAAVDYYCESLKGVCGFRYVSQAVIMDAAKDQIRYFLVFATNSIHGIEVFKEAEAAAARAQDEIRHETRLKKQPQFGLPFGDTPPKTARVLSLQKRYIERMREQIIGLLARQSSWCYDDLYGEAMALPLVTRADLDHVLHMLEPNIRVDLSGLGRKKMRLHKDDRIVVVNRTALQGGR